MPQSGAAVSRGETRRRQTWLDLPDDDVLARHPRPTSQPARAERSLEDASSASPDVAVRAPDARTNGARTNGARANGARTNGTRTNGTRTNGTPMPRANGTGVPGRRTVTIRGQVTERYQPTSSRRRPPSRAHERPGFRPDRMAMWAVLLGLALVLIAATSSHAAVLLH